MKLQDKHEHEFETYLNNIGLKDVTKDKHLLYYGHFNELYGGFITQKTIDSFLTLKTSPNHRAMIQHLIDLLKRDSTLNQEDMLEINRLVILKRVGRIKRNEIQILTKIEIKRLLDNCRLSDDFQTEKFKLMVHFQYSGGLRLSELCSLNWENLNFQGRDKFFAEGRDKLKYQKLYLPPEITKGNKGAYVYIKTDVYLAYFDFFKEWSKRDSALCGRIVNNQKSIWAKNKVKYSVDFKDQVFKTLGFKLPENKSTHILRHSRATHLLQEGMPIEEVKEFMRHSSLSVTEVYVHLAEDSVSKRLETLGTKKSESSP